jgi:hypothetical protein
MSPWGNMETRTTSIVSFCACYYNGAGKHGLLGDTSPTEEYVTVNQQTSVIAEPPPIDKEVSFPIRSFGYATQQYWAFLEALLNGLRAYEAQAERRDHAPTPLPAA